MFRLPGYQFVSNNRTGYKGGLAIYIRYPCQYKICDDLTININNEVESIFTKIDQHLHKLVIGEIYRVPGTNAQISILEYQKILHMLSTISGRAMIAMNQNFNCMNIDHRGITVDLIDALISSSFVPTITEPTRITHYTATLIINLYMPR